MNTNSTRLLTEPTFEFGGEARGTAADSSAGVEGKISSSEQPGLVYDERKGLYGGVAIKGGAVAPADDATPVYYEQAVTIKDILFEKKVQPTAAGSALGAKLTDYSRKPTKESK